MHDAGSVGAILAPGRPPGKHLDDAASEGPHVARLASTQAFDHFWGHPVGRATNLAILRGHGDLFRLIPTILVTDRYANCLQLGRGSEVG